MALRRPGDKPLSEPMMVGLLTHICVTRPRWVKSFMILIIFLVLDNICCTTYMNYTAVVHHVHFLVQIASLDICNPSPSHLAVWAYTFVYYLNVFGWSDDSSWVQSQFMKHEADPAHDKYKQQQCSQKISSSRWANPRMVFSAVHGLSFRQGGCLCFFCFFFSNN